MPPPAAPSGPIRCPAAPPKLACPANADVLQQLVALRLRVLQRNIPGNRYYYTVQRALESVAKHDRPITTYADLVAIKFVGPSIAKNVQFEGGEETVEGGGDATTTDKDTKKRANNNTTNNSNKPAKKKKADAVNQQQLFVVHPAPVASATKAAAPKVAADTAPAGRKEALYEQAVRDAERWKDIVAHQSLQERKLRWRVVLLIDIREQWCEYMQAQCTMSGIPCESRALPIGDMMWIVQGFCKNKANDDEGEDVLLELVCGTILERKTPEDLKSSIFGSRYMEQRLRLQNSGIPQIVFLIEGDASKDLYACSMDTLHTAIWETRLLMDFRILHTAHADDTVQTLKRLHRRILQRTFPRTFQRTEALPHFRAAMGHPSKSSSSSSTDHGGRHRRERRQSLANLTFDVDPVEPLGMPRFISYAELKAKIQWDRERGTQSIHSLHLAMLKQVPTWYAKKCLALAAVYPTVHALCAALAATHRSSRHSHHNPYQPKKEHIVAHIPLSQAAAATTQTATTTIRTIGTRSSEELYLCYTGGGSEEMVTSTQSSSSSNSPSAPLPSSGGTAPPMPSLAVAAPANHNPSPPHIYTMEDSDDDSCDYTRANAAPTPASTYTLSGAAAASHKPLPIYTMEDSDEDSSDDNRENKTPLASAAPPEIWCVDSDEDEPTKPAARNVYPGTSFAARTVEDEYNRSVWEAYEAPPAAAKPCAHRHHPTAFSQDVIELLSD